MQHTTTILSKDLMALQQELKKFKSIRFTNNAIRVSSLRHMVYLEGSQPEISALLYHDMFKEEYKKPIPKTLSGVWNDFCDVLFGKK